MSFNKQKEISQAERTKQKVIFVAPVKHKNENRIKLIFKYDISLINIVKGIRGSRWSSSMNCWHVPDAPEMIQSLYDLFLNKAFVDCSAVTKQQQKNTIIEVKKQLSPAEQHDTQLIEELRKWMKHKRYSLSSINTYCGAVLVFIRFLKPKPIEEAVGKDFVKFTNEYVLANRLSSSYQNQVINAIKLFFREVVNCEIDIDKIERPRQEHKLPNVLSKEEVKSILTALTNQKHKTMLSLIYACGLRRSEVLKLKPGDVDSGRGLLIIRDAKGKKDRVTPLPDKIIDMLREYYKTYHPVNWLFEGQTKGEQYTGRSLEEVLKKSITLAKIKKPVTLHWLRHSYATHLLEGGTDLRYIQEILGHKSSKTTEIYTHVSTKQLQKIKSPIDDFDI